MFRKWFKIIFLIVVILSFAANVFFIGNYIKAKWIVKIQQQTISQLITVINNDLQRTGKIVLQTPNGQIVLVPEKSQTGE